MTDKNDKIKPRWDSMYKEIMIKDLQINPFSMLSNEWMLITTGSKTKYNSMTASWGGFGVLWNKNVATAYIRNTRYTYELMNSNDYFTLSFYDEKYQYALKVLGTLSGRQSDKIGLSELTPTFEENAPFFTEAKMVFVCKKIYHSDIDPKNFDDKTIDSKIYPLKDYHRLFIGEIIKILVQE